MKTDSPMPEEITQLSLYATKHKMQFVVVLRKGNRRFRTYRQGFSSLTIEDILEIKRTVDRVLDRDIAKKAKPTL